MLFLFRSRRPKPDLRRPRLCRPRLEVLEDRSVPSTVSNLLDSGPGSLRQAILDTPAGGTVGFQPGLRGTIALTGGQLVITQNLTIAGPGADAVTVSGNHATRVFDITGSNHTVAISGLTIADGRTTTDRGGAIENLLSTLTLSDCVLRGNAVVDSGSSATGGAINNEGGTLTIRDSTLSGNSVSAPSGVIAGGAISNFGTLTVLNSTLSGNSATASSGGGGGIANGGTATLLDSTLSGNSAAVGGAS